MPGALAMAGPTGVRLLVFFSFSISVVSCCRVLIVVLSLCSFGFYVFGDFAWVGGPSRGLGRCLVCATAELTARVVAAWC